MKKKQAVPIWRACCLGVLLAGYSAKSSKKRAVRGGNAWSGLGVSILSYIPRSVAVTQTAFVGRSIVS